MSETVKIQTDIRTVDGQAVREWHQSFMVCEKKHAAPMMSNRLLDFPLDR